MFKQEDYVFRYLAEVTFEWISWISIVRQTQLISICISYPFFNPPAYNALHCIFSLLKPLPTDLTSFIRGNIHISFPLFNIHILKNVISIVVYLSMYNRQLVTSRCLA